MNIEEAYNTIKKSVVAINTRPYATKAEYEKVECIKVLLTAYEKEKGENVKLRLQDIPLMEGEVKAYKDRVNELKQELEKEKEKNKELNKLKGFEMLDIFNMGKQSSRQRIEFDYVDKEKIKERIKEYYEYDKRMQNKPDWHTTKYYEAKALEKLLEE